jgi:hypothetical protein
MTTLAEALRELLNYFDNPRRDEWCNDVEWKRACIACNNARAALADHEAQQQQEPAQQLERWGKAEKGSGYLLQPREGGYWTPWHVAQDSLDAAVSKKAQQQEPSQDAKDAARWRYWLEHHGWSGYFDDGASNEDSPAAVNAAIDEAMEAKK